MARIRINRSPEQPGLFDRPSPAAVEVPTLPWDEGGRDEYFSKLPGDAELVAGDEVLNRPLNVNPGLRAPDPVEPPRLVRTRIAPGIKQDSSGSAGSTKGNEVESAPSGACPARPAQPDETKPFSHFTQTNQLSAIEATRAVRGQSLGYTGVWFCRTRVAVCRDCHQAMTAGTEQYTPKGFEGQGPMAVIYNCQQRKPNVDAKCGVCGNVTIGEVVGLDGRY